MAGLRVLRKIQLGAEATAGTAVAATTIWRGMGVLEGLTEVVFVPEDVGVVAPYDRTYIPSVGGQIAMDEVPATFEQLGYILSAGVKLATGATDGTGSDYIYTYTFPTTAVNTIQTYTIEGGDNQQAEEMEYAFVTDFRLAGGPNEALSMSATWLGRQVATTTFTGALSVPTVEDVLFNECQFYIDASSGTHGTTEKAGTLISAELNVDTGLRARKAADGNLYFTDVVQKVKPSVVLSCSLEHDAVAVAEKAAWEAKTVRLLQLKFEGADLATAGTTYSKKTVIVNLTGKWENFGAMEDHEGDDVIPATFRAAYNATDAHFAEIIVVNELSALP